MKLAKSTKLLFLAILVVFSCQTYASPYGEDITAHGADGTDEIDDYAAIQSAILAAATGSKKVIIPPGEFIVGQTITMASSIYDNIEFVGVSWASVIRHTDSDVLFKIGSRTTGTNSLKFEKFRIIGHPSASAAFLFEKGNRSRISNLRIDNYTDPQANNGEGAAAIKYDYTWIHTVENVLFNNVFYGVYGNNVYNLNIVQCNMEGVIKDGVLIKGSYSINIRDNAIESGSMDSAVRLQNATTVNITGNYIENPNHPGNIHSSGYAAIQLGVGPAGLTEAVNITGNYFNLSRSDYFISVHNSRGTTISGNRFHSSASLSEDQAPRIGFILAYTGLRSNGLFVSGNAIPVNFDWGSREYISKNEPGTIYRGLIYDQKSQSIIHGSKNQLAIDCYDPGSLAIDGCIFY